MYMCGGYEKLISPSFPAKQHAQSKCDIPEVHFDRALLKQAQPLYRLASSSDFPVYMGSGKKNERKIEKNSPNQHFILIPARSSPSLISNITCTPTNKAAQAATK